MSRYIDADALINDIPKEYHGSTIHMMINKAPSIDIVRCGECNHWWSDGGAIMFCEHTDIPTEANDFCSWGDRKESE